MAREHRFAVRGDPDRHVRVTHQHAETQITVGMQRGQLLRWPQHMHGAVGQRAEPGWDHAPVEFFAEQFHLHPAVIAGHEDATPDTGRDDHIGVGAQAIRFGERSGRDDAEIPAAVIGGDPHHRLDGDGLDGVLRQQHGDRPILGTRGVEHSAAHRARGVLWLAISGVVGDRFQVLLGQAGQVLVGKQGEVPLWFAGGRLVGHGTPLLAGLALGGYAALGFWWQWLVAGRVRGLDRPQEFLPVERGGTELFRHVEQHRVAAVLLDDGVGQGDGRGLSAQRWFGRPIEHVRRGVAGCPEDTDRDRLAGAAHEVPRPLQPMSTQVATVHHVGDIGPQLVHHRELQRGQRPSDREQAAVPARRDEDELAVPDEQLLEHVQTGHDEVHGPRAGQQLVGCRAALAHPPIGGRQPGQHGPFGIGRYAPAAEFGERVPAVVQALR